MFALDGGPGAGAWWTRLAPPDAPKIIARLPFVERTDHPAGLPVFVISKPLVDGGAREVVLEVGHARPLARRRSWSLAPNWRGSDRLRRRWDGAFPAGGAAREYSGRRGERGAALGRRRRRAGVRGRRARGSIRRLGVAQTRELRLIEAAMTTHSVLKPQPRPEILAIDPYVPGKSRVPGVAKVHKLSSNKSPLGASPKAIEALRACAGESRALSRRSVDSPSGGDRPPLRSRSGANHLRQRLRRAARAARARVSAAGR